MDIVKELPLQQDHAQQELALMLLQRLIQMLLVLLSRQDAKQLGLDVLQLWDHATHTQERVQLALSILVVMGTAQHPQVKL